MPTSHAELLKRLHYLTLVAGQSHGPSLIGPRQKKLSVGLRDYSPGDDYRHVDWNRCARHDELMTRTFDPFDDRPIYVLLDCSPSMEVGQPSKLEVARQITTAIGYLATKDLSRFSVTTFADGILGDGPTIRDPSRLGKLLRFLGQLAPQGTGTDLERTAEHFVHRYQRHGPVVVVSDLYDRDGFRRGFDILRGHGYEPRLVQIIDPAEAKPTFLGDVELLDMEAASGQQATITERSVGRYVEIYAAFLDSVRDYCSRCSIPCMQITTDTPKQSVLLEILGGRPVGAT
ncbi:MAG: DUF58 domain-containing protein [Thermoguttaceae bacterium]